MPEIEIRAAKEEDYETLLQIEHNYASDYVWQMDIQREERDVRIHFRRVKLPRSVQVNYPRSKAELESGWESRDGVLVATLEDELVGYACLMRNLAPRTTWVTDLVVKRGLRWQGIGTTLILASQAWAQQHKTRRMILEMQPKNDPAISLAEKLGFELCGYNDHYFANHDIALFFSRWLR